MTYFGHGPGRRDQGPSGATKIPDLEELAALVTAEAMKQLQDMLIASAVMKDSARVKYEDVVVADFAKKAQ